MCTLMYMRLAICWLFSPWATSWEAAHSVSVRLAQPLAGLTAKEPRWRRHTPSLRSRCRMRPCRWSRGLGVSVQGLGQAADGLVLVRLAGQQDAEVFCRRRPGPGVFVLCCGLGQAGRVAVGQAQGVGRGGGEDPEPGIVTGQDLGGAGHRGRQLLVPGGARYPDQPGRGGGFCGEEPAARPQAGADVPDEAEGGDGAGAGLGDLGFGQSSLRAGVDAGGLRHRGGPARDVPGRGREVSPAQRDHAENAAGDPGVPVGRQRLGAGQGGLGFGGGVGEPAAARCMRARRIGGTASEGMPCSSEEISEAWPSVTRTALSSRRPWISSVSSDGFPAAPEANASRF